jgi:hypothetical protein
MINYLFDTIFFISGQINSQVGSGSVINWSPGIRIHDP